MVSASLSAVTGGAPEAVLTLTDSSLPVANGIVREIMSNVETVTFGHPPESGLMVIVNNGALHDHMLLARLALVPIHMDAVELDGYRREAIVYELRAKCPKDATGLLDVTSRDFRVYDADGKDLGPKQAHHLFPVDPVSRDAVLITSLRRGEEIHVKGHAVKASGSKHACFCPVSRCALVHSDPRAPADAEEGEPATGGKGKGKARAAAPAPEDTEEDEPTHFRITLRSECGLTPKELLVRGLMSLRGRVAAVVASVLASSQGEPGGSASAASVAAAAATVEGVPVTSAITEVKFDTGAVLHEVRFSRGQDSTLGELLQLHLLRVAPAFAGYDVPHNLDELMILRFDAMGKDPATVFGDAAKGAIAEITATLAAVEKA